MKDGEAQATTASSVGAHWVELIAPVRADAAAAGRTITEQALLAAGAVAWELVVDPAPRPGGGDAFPGRSPRATDDEGSFGIVHPDDRAWLKAALGRALSGEASYDFEFRLLGPDGEVEWVRDQGQLVADDGGGPRRLAGLAQRITHQRRIQDAFMATFEQAAIGMAHVAPDGRFLRVNAYLCRFLGRTSGDLMHLGFQAITHPDDLEADLSEVTALLAGRIQTYSLEKRYLRQDGAAVWAKLTVSLVRRPNGAPDYFISVVEDISERKAVEAALVESQRRLRAILDGLPIMTAVQGVDGRLEFISRWYQNYVGRTPMSDLQGRMTVVHPDDRPAYIASRRRAIEGGAEDDVEARIRRHDGAWRWHSVRTIPFDWGDGQKAFLAAAVDIHDLREAADRIALSEARLRIAQRAGRIGTFDWGLASNNATYSDQYAALHGLPPGTETESYGSWSARIHPEDRAEALIRSGDLSEGGPSELSYRIIRPSDGQIRWIAERREVFRDADGRAVRVIGSQQDVTEQRAAAEILARDRDQLERLVAERTRALSDTEQKLAHAQRLDALGQLAGGIAHDFNNVLQAVEGLAGLIVKRAGDNEEIQRLAQMVTGAASRGSAITRRLLAFSRRGDLRTERVVPAQLLSDLQEVLTHTLGAGIGVVVDAPEDLPAVLVDKAQLETVILNLATNARDAMDGKGVVTLGARRDVLAEDQPSALFSMLSAGRYVRIWVEDTGSGMAPEVLQRATEPFFTTKARGQGTGLGLAMARGFAEQSGGGLRIDSAPGRGAAVSLWFPLAEDSSTRPPAGAPSAPSASASRSASVLVVDDEPMVAEVLAEGLRDAGYRVTSAPSGAAALSLLDAGALVDLLISDLSMPEMDGLELLAAVRSRRPDLPAILLTGFARDTADLFAAAPRLGMFSLLRKPVTAEALADRVAALLAAPAEG